jgi:hypothetical protein
MNDTAIDDSEVITVQNKMKWFFSQTGQLVIAVGLLSLIYNYTYRAAVDWGASSPTFYISTVLMALITFVIVRRDYIFIRKYEFRNASFTVHTLAGAVKTYERSKYEWVPALHKTVNFPEKKASLSFYVQDIKTGKNIRNYSWAGFSSEDFRRVSTKYGYRTDVDFKQKDFGRS